ncbi:MAG: GNAT family N-acetyltransferase [Clostridiales bacterium]|nr:GNAT family N-acetyltransferase [Clostridiales bacterium]
MIFTPVTFTLKDGRTGILRSPDPKADAADLVQYLYDTAADTPFVLRTPEEIRYTVEGEERFLQNVLDSCNDCFIVCEVNGHIAGNCHLSFNTRVKTRHSCSVAIALRKAYWGNGIGTAMFAAMEDIARQREGVIQMDLEFIEGNARARGLYEKAGFRIVGIHPDAIRQEDGTMCALFAMQKKL